MGGHEMATHAGVNANHRKRSIVQTTFAPITTRSTVGVLDIPLALFSPRRVFARVEDVTAYWWPLTLLLVSVTLIGYAYVETGLIDRAVERRVQANIALLEKTQTDVVERSAMSKMIAEQLKEGEFLRLMARIQAVVIEPIGVLAVVLLIPAMFYGLVALTGKKPEWHTLVTICVFASFADALGALARLLMMIRFETEFVDTSLAPLARLMDVADASAAAPMAGLSGLMTALDPFRIWFWIILAIGLVTTSQLRGWKVWLSCSLCWLLAAAMRAALMIGAVSSPPPT